MNQFLLEAVKNRINNVIIQKYLSNAAGCAVTDSGSPTISNQGLVFFGVHSGASRNIGSDGGNYLKERYFFNVTITMKTGRIGKYMLGQIAFDQAESGMSYLVDLVKRALHGYSDLATETDELVSASIPDAQGFVWGEQPIWISSSEPTPRTPSWFGSKLEDKGGVAGISTLNQFSGLTLIRYISNLTL